MNSQTLIELPTCRLLLVPYFKCVGVYNLDVSIDHEEEWYQLECTYKNDDEDSGFYGEDISEDIEIPKGNWEILGSYPDGITEEQAKGIVETRCLFVLDGIKYLDYCKPHQNVDTAIESLRLLFKKNRIEEGKNYVLLIDKK